MFDDVIIGLSDAAFGRLPIAQGKCADELAHFGANPRGELAVVGPKLLDGKQAERLVGVFDALFEPQLGVAKPLPFFDEAGVDPLEHGAEVAEDVENGVVLDEIGDVLVEGLVELREIPQQDALEAVEPVFLHIVAEVEIVLDHFAADGLGFDHVAADPGVELAEVLEDGEEIVGAGLGRGDLIELVHPLVIAHPLGLEPVDEFGLDDIELSAQNDGRVFEHRFNQAEQIEGEVGILGIQPLDGLDEEEREVVEEREVELEIVVDHDPVVRALGVPDHLDDAGVFEGPRELGGVVEVARLAGVVIVAVADKLAQRVEVAGQRVVDGGVALEKIDHHPWSDPEA